MKEKIINAIQKEIEWHENDLKGLSNEELKIHRKYFISGLNQALGIVKIMPKDE